MMWWGCNANKTNENRSVRTGQGELANMLFEALDHVSGECFQCISAEPNGSAELLLNSAGKLGLQVV